MSAHPHRTLGFLACALASSFWGCGFFFGKIALAEMNVGAMVFYRFAFAALVLAPLLFTHRAQFTQSEWRALLLCALLGIPLQFLAQFSGLARTTVSHAALMVGTMPVLLAVAATLFAHERMDLTGWLALAVSTAGAALIALGAHNSDHPQSSGAPFIAQSHRAMSGMETHLSTPTLSGDLLVVLSLVIALGWILLNKRLMQRHSAIAVSAYVTVAGTLMLAVSVPILYGPPPGLFWSTAHVSARAWLALAASGLLSTASATLLWNWGIQRVPVSQAGVLLNMEPLLGSILGVFLLGDTLGPSARIGGALILAAAILITTRSTTRVREQLPST